jgi:chromosome segregation ATPase
LPGAGRRRDDGAVTEEPQPQPQSRHPARKWVVASVVLLVAVAGLGAYALSLRSDVEDKDAQIAAQEQELEEQEGVAAQVRGAAEDLGDDARQALAELGDQIDDIESQANASQEETMKAIDDAEKAAEDAQARAGEAQDDVEEANARADEAQAQAEAAGACARGYLSAFGNAFEAATSSGDVSAAKSELESLNQSCLDKVGS